MGNHHKNNKSFNFYIYLAPYNMENEQIGKVELHKVNSNTLVLDFIKKTFKGHDWKLVHLINTKDNLEID